jgi:hypothetical protein
VAEHGTLFNGGSDMFLRKGSSGAYYVCRRTGGGGTGKLGHSMTYRDWFLIRHRVRSEGAVLIWKSISIPADLVGKRIRFKVEILDDAWKPQSDDGYREKYNRLLSFLSKFPWFKGESKNESEVEHGKDEEEKERT